MQAQHIGDSCFHYGHASNDYMSSCVATNNCWTTLEYDECNVIFHGIC